jgi:hypothetical protein
MRESKKCAFFVFRRFLGDRPEISLPSLTFAGEVGISTTSTPNATTITNPWQIIQTDLNLDLICQDLNQLQFELI